MSEKYKYVDMLSLVRRGGRVVIALVSKTSGL